MDEKTSFGFEDGLGDLVTEEFRLTNLVYHGALVYNHGDLYAIATENEEDGVLVFEVLYDVGTDFGRDLHGRVLEYSKYCFGVESRVNQWEDYK